MKDKEILTEEEIKPFIDNIKSIIGKSFIRTDNRVMPVLELALKRGVESLLSKKMAEELNKLKTWVGSDPDDIIHAIDIVLSKYKLN